LIVRLYWRPRAEDARRTELLSNTSTVALIYERTVGYYNNDQTDPIRRLGVALLENSLFSKTIALEMAKKERIKVSFYVFIFFILLLIRQTDLVIASTAAQAVFSEQIVSQWLRLEWLRVRFDSTYNSLYTLFQSKPPKAVLYAKVLESFAFYETGKSNSGIALSSKTFRRLNPILSADWEKIKATLRI
jgi:hypothetical protein